MVFSSPTFIFLFLPVVLLLYALSWQRAKNLLLLLASLLFYAWGEGFYTAVMLLSITANYFFGLAVERYRHGRAVITVAITANLLLLASYKYANFFVDNFNQLLSLASIDAILLPPVHLPIGISFFTFHAISYLIDVHRGEVPTQRNYINLSLYIALFPQLIAGPIIRYHDVDGQLESRTVTLDDLNYGIRRFIIGFAKKMLIANQLGQVADKIFSLPADQLSPELAWLGITCYTLQIFFDFAGYSDMAIGLGRMFGFHFLENFNYPYISTSIQEFWRRWHMSLSRWFRDYLYIPLGGNRKGSLRTYLNLATVFVLCGFWHGASWNFIIWGFIHGAFLIIERNTHFHGAIARHRLIGHLYVMLVVMVAWVFFRAETLDYSIAYLSQMFALSDQHGARTVGEFINNEILLFLIAGIIASTPVMQRIHEWRNHFVARRSQIKTYTTLLNPVGNVLLALIYIELFLTSASYLAANSYNPFIYFRF